MSCLDVGSSLRLLYPIRNQIVGPLTFRPREMVIRRVRDLAKDPLTIKEFRRRPMLFRGRYLVLGVCSDGRFRQFYPALCGSNWSPGILRLALFDPDSPAALPTIISRGVDDTIRGRSIMEKMIQQTLSKDLGGLQLRVLVDDFRIKASYAAG